MTSDTTTPAAALEYLATPQMNGTNVHFQRISMKEPKMIFLWSYKVVESRVDWTGIAAAAA